MLIRCDALRDRIKDSEVHRCKEIFHQYKQARLADRQDAELLSPAKYNALVEHVGALLDNWQDSQYSELRKMNDQLCKTIEDKDRLINDQSERVDEQFDTIADLEKSLINKENELARSEVECDGLREENEKLQVLINEQSEKIREWKSKSEKTLGELQTERYEWGGRERALLQRVECLEMIKNELKRQYEKAMTSLRQLTETEGGQAQKKRRLSRHERLQRAKDALCHSMADGLSEYTLARDLARGTAHGSDASESSEENQGAEASPHLEKDWSRNEESPRPSAENKATILAQNPVNNEGNNNRFEADSTGITLQDRRVQRATRKMEQVADTATKVFDRLMSAMEEIDSKIEEVESYCGITSDREEPLSPTSEH